MRRRGGANKTRRSAILVGPLHEQWLVIAEAGKGRRCRNSKGETAYWPIVVINCLSQDSVAKIQCTFRGAAQGREVAAVIGLSHRESSHVRSNANCYRNQEDN